MQHFTGWQYLLIDVANNYHMGLDKQTFENRIAWAEENLDDLEDLAQGDHWKERPLYLKAVQALRKAQQGKPTGHLVGLDAVCSGMQLMAVMTGCKKAASATGLVDPTTRADAYSECTKRMAQKLGTEINVERSKVKNAVMTSLYGSKQEPKNEFGEGEELKAFYEALYDMAPGPCMLLKDLLDSWQPWAMSHTWKLPDGYDVRIKTLKKITQRIEVSELHNSSFTYQYYNNEGLAYDRKNAANVVHSVDAYVLRSLLRRCNYDANQVSKIHDIITAELIEADPVDTLVMINPEARYYFDQFLRSGVIDITVVDYLDGKIVKALPDDYLRRLNKVLSSMLSHRPFEVVTIHDDFKAHPNNLNQLRAHYKDILADIADSDLMSDIFTQIYGQPALFTKESSDLGTLIRNSNYALS